MLVGIPTELARGDRRVALVPDAVPPLLKKNLEVALQAGAGTDAEYPDALYAQKGATVLSSREELFAKADIVAEVSLLTTPDSVRKADLALMRKGQALIGFMNPLGAPAIIKDLAARGVTAFALELLPRITRAQSMDALSSMATCAGYKAVLIAAEALPRFLPMFMTAAGTVTPARVLVIGAGVAGLQAIATAKRLGALVHAYDVRPAVKQEVESLGGKFVELELETTTSADSGGYAKALGEEFYARQRELMHSVIAKSDVVITTAAVPGKKAPVLVTKAMVEAMPSGSVIVDLAAEQGGNCELTEAGETVVHQRVKIIGPVNLPSSVAYHASQMYSKNVTTFLLNIIKDGKLALDLDDEIVRETLVTRDGEVVNARVKELLK
ncbi:MAG: Re/Si-specific NAD(P)(+) transhydrogenase subunit alpha [bacterium]|nr:Re/Si-specific NAD(P)(+) transhydrogenase subunit alpha [bacterium]